MKKKFRFVISLSFVMASFCSSTGNFIESVGFAKESPGNLETRYGVQVGRWSQETLVFQAPHSIQFYINDSAASPAIDLEVLRWTDLKRQMLEIESNLPLDFGTCFRTIRFQKGTGEFVSRCSDNNTLDGRFVKLWKTLRNEVRTHQK